MCIKKERKELKEEAQRLTEEKNANIDGLLSRMKVGRDDLRGEAASGGHGGAAQPVFASTGKRPYLWDNGRSARITQCGEKRLCKKRLPFRVAALQRVFRAVLWTVRLTHGLKRDAFRGCYLSEGMQNNGIDAVFTILQLANLIHGYDSARRPSVDWREAKMQAQRDRYMHAYHNGPSFRQACLPTNLLYKLL